MRRFLTYFLTVLSVIASVSCVKDTLDDNGGVMYVEGRETYVRLRLSVPDMTIATRSDMPDGSDYEVNSLWVGIFSATTGRCTYAEMRPEVPNKHNPFIPLGPIKTESGASYIVAVANPADNYGYLYDKNSAKVVREPLTDILPQSVEDAESKGFTWESYQNIAIRQLELNDVNTPIGNLVMSGVYHELESDPHSPVNWEEDNYKPVNIPVSGNGVVEMDGAIHLRRLISQVRFNIRAVDYSGTNENKNGLRVLQVIPQSFQVKNVPYTSWLHERRGPSSVEDIEKGNWPTANSGDVIRIDNASNSNPLGYDDSKGSMTLRANYRNSVWFNGNQYLIPQYDDDRTTNPDPISYTFDFWMMENKRWAVRDLEGDYERREKEIKRDRTQEAGYEYMENTGIYTALCGDEGESTLETMNNCASFVELRCRIIYTDDGLDAIGKEDAYKDVEYRSAEAIYTIHLGGIGGDWNDFCHRRNHKYTYNVTVMDIDRIIVEARQDDEPRPGIEGVVTDVVNPPFEVDCHYACFNIQLSNIERTGGGIVQEDGDEPNTGGLDGGHEVNGGKYERGLFPFRIRYYDSSNFAHYIDQSNIDEYMTPDKKLYWTWVEFRPTTGPDDIADYKPYEGEGADGQTFRLNEVADIAKYRHHDDKSRSKEDPDLPDEDDTSLHWYTVFVNEYVYETGLDEGANNFMNYVNLSPRMCWMNTLFRSSIDDESNYIRSKYVVRQQSIQTFYANIPVGIGPENDFNAIGMEHINETFGFNLRWENVPTEFEGEDRTHNIQNNNGRHNTLLYIFDEGHLTRGTEWREYMNPNRLQYISGINRGSNQYDYSYQLKEAPYLAEGAEGREPYYLPAIFTSNRDNSTMTNPGSQQAVSAASNINTTYYLRILDACMNRNRDNNGNGVIDIDEIRWYVPASSEIIDFVLGRNSLETPLLDYNINYQLNSPGNSQTEQSHQGNTRFHYATSNQRVLWAEEGATINPEVDFFTGTWNLPPQNVRCVRALGTDLSTDENKDLTPAFTTNAEFSYDAAGQRVYTFYPTHIYPTYYEQKNQRSYSSDAIEPHQEMTPQNRLCYYGFEFSKELLTFRPVTISVWTEGSITYPAGYYADGIQDHEHYLGTTEGGMDPQWLEKNPQWKTCTNEQDIRYGMFFLPDTDHYGGGDRNTPPADGYTSEGNDSQEPPGSGYLYMWWDSWSEGNTTYNGWYLPDESSWAGDDINNKPDGVYDWWDEYEKPGGTLEWGWYLPDTSKRYDNQTTGTEYWDTFFAGGVYYGPGGYSPILETYHEEEFEDGVYFTSYKDGQKLDFDPGYYTPDVSQANVWGPLTEYLNGFYLNKTRYEAGYYKPDPDTRVGWGEGNSPGAGYKYFQSGFLIPGGDVVKAGWYKPLVSSRTDGQNGDSRRHQFNETVYGKVYPAGWYRVDIGSATYDTGGNNRYKRGPHIVYTKPSGYYTDGIMDEEHYLGTQAPPDPEWENKNPRWMQERSEPTDGAWAPREVRGEYTDASGFTSNMFAYNEGSFVNDHGTTLAAANKICEESYGRGWRLPNMKEASLIKIAMDNAGVYKAAANGNNYLTRDKYVDPVSGYEVGNFLACTFREYGITGPQSRDQKDGYYTGIYYAETNDEVQPGDWTNGTNSPLIGRIACITTGWNRHYYIRCVRDLQSSGE